MARNLIHFIRTAEDLDKSLRFSVNYARKSGLNIILLMVLEQRHEYFYPMTSPMRATMPTYEFEMIREKRLQEEEERLEKFIESQKKTSDNPNISYVIETGATDMVITDYSKKPENEMIVINESQEPENGFIINTYLNILENTACPIVKVPEAYNNKMLSMKKILYATDYKEEDIPTLRRIASIASSFGSEITALHITESIDLEEKLLSHGFEASVMEKIDYDKIKMRLLKNDDVVKGVLEYSKDSDFDLIALLKENRNFIQRIFRRSDSNKILSKSDLPVMVIPEK